MGGFLKWWYISPTNPWFFPQEILGILGCELGVYHHFRKHPYDVFGKGIFPPHSSTELHPDSDHRLHREASHPQRMSRRMAFNAVFPLGKDWVRTMRDPRNGGLRLKDL